MNKRYVNLARWKQVLGEYQYTSTKLGLDGLWVAYKNVADPNKARTTKTVVGGFDPKEKTGWLDFGILGESVTSIDEAFTGVQLSASDAKKIAAVTKAADIDLKGLAEDVYGQLEDELLSVDEVLDMIKSPDTDDMDEWSLDKAGYQKALKQALSVALNEWNNDSKDESSKTEMMYNGNDKKLIGEFQNSYGKWFTYSLTKSEFAHKQGFKHEIDVTGAPYYSPVRFGNVMKTRAIVAIDEGDDGKVITQTWNFKKHIVYKNESLTSFNKSDKVSLSTKRENQMKNEVSKNEIDPAHGITLAEIKVGDIFTDEYDFYKILGLNKSTAKVVQLDFKAKDDGTSNGSAGNSSGTKVPTSATNGSPKDVRMGTVRGHGNWPTTGFITGSGGYKRYATRWSGRPIGYDHYS